MKSSRRARDPEQEGITHYVKFIGMAVEEQKRCHEEGIEKGVVMIGAKK